MKTVNKIALGVSLSVVFLGLSVFGLNSTTNTAEAVSLTQLQNPTLIYDSVVGTGCLSQGQSCSPEVTIDINVPKTGPLKLDYQVPAAHCSSVKVAVSIDGVPVGNTGWLGYQGIAPMSGSFTTDPVSAGTRRLSFKALGTPGGCNRGKLIGWGLTTQIYGEKQVVNTGACSTDSQCGTTGYTGSQICQNGNVWQNYTTNTCLNPGTATSTCSTSTALQQKTVCGSNQTCSSGTCVNNATLTASCSANPSVTNVNQPVTFNPIVSGGTGSYTYQWSNGCSAFSQNCSRTFTSDGTYTAILTVTSGTQTANTSCNATINPVATTNQCSDGIDNDNDGAIDYPNDFSCGSASDNDEANPKAQCQDGIDNDNDGLIDFPQDSGCSSRQDNNEFNTTGSIVCSSNSQCGTNGFTGNSFCSGNGVYQNYTTWTCNNAGTTNSSCSQQTTQQLQTTCGFNQTCTGSGICTNNNTTTVGTIITTTQVRNLSSGSLNWVTSVAAAPGDVVQFQIAVTNNSNQPLNNLTVRTTLPANLIYNDNVTLDGVNNSGSIVSGLFIGNLSAGQTRLVTYQARVAGPENFAFGTTTITANTAVTSTDSNVNPQNSSASIMVTRGGVLGATTVSTGLLGDNPVMNWFLLPLLMAIFGAWLFRSQFSKFPQWMSANASRNKEAVAERELQNRIVNLN